MLVTTRKLLRRLFNNKMATFRQVASPAKSTLLLYIWFIFQIAVNAFDSSVLHWNDPSQVADIHAGSLRFTDVPRSVLLRSSPTNIKLQDIPQVISLALGFSSLQNIDWEGLSSGSLFDRPKANVLFIIDGLSKGNTVPFSGESQTYTILKNKVNSDFDIFRVSPTRNFVSHISSMSNDKPLVMSFSAQKQFAKAASASGRNAHTVSWNAEEGLFKDEAGSNKIQLSKDELLKLFETADFGEGVKYLKKELKFLVSKPGMEDVSFNMNEMDNFLFFAEIQTLFYLHEKVKNFDSLIHDDVADFFTFGISTLKGLSQRYGNGSEQVAAALHILSNVIPKISKLCNEMYDGQALVEVVNLEKKEQNEQKIVSNDINDVYEDSEREPRVRRDVSTEPGGPRAGPCENKKNFAAVDDYYDDEFPPIFNIILWLMVILVLTVYVVALVMWYMDPGRDSVIYRVTSQHIKSE